MAESDEKLSQMIAALNRQTAQRKLDWTLTDAERTDIFGASTRHFSIVLSTVDADGMAPYAVEISDDKGATVERFTTDTLSDLYDDVVKLYEEVRGQVPLPPTRIDDFIAELDELGGSEGEV